MTNCFEKARELGQSILYSDAALRLHDTRAALEEGRANTYELMEAENVLNDFAEQVINLVRATVYGTVDAGGGCSSCCMKGK